MGRLTMRDGITGELHVLEEERLLRAKGYYDKDEMYKIMRHLAEKLAEFEDLAEQGLLKRFPCKVGDFALFCGGTILPVVSITLSQDKQITVGCQNGIMVSADMSFSNYGGCIGFYRTMEEAEQALRKARESANINPDMNGNVKG